MTLAPYACLVTGSFMLRKQKKSVIRDERGGNGQADPVSTLTSLTDTDSIVQSLRKEALVLFPLPGPRGSVFQDNRPCAFYVSVFLP